MTNIELIEEIIDNENKAENKMIKTFEKKENIKFRKTHEIIFLGKYLSRGKSLKEKRNKIKNKNISKERMDKYGNEEESFIYIKEKNK